MIEIDSYKCATINLGKVKTNQPRASQICIRVIFVLSIKLLCDVLIGRELNEITPTDDWTFYDKPLGIRLAAVF